MTIDIRQVCHPEAVRRFDTRELRRHFLIERLFAPGEVLLTYSHIDRLVIGGAQPAGEAVALPVPKAIGRPTFLERRELGIVNVGGPGAVEADGRRLPMAARDALYVAMGSGPVRFLSDDPARPAKFYLVSTPAHARHETTHIPLDRARRLELGDAEHANTRTLYQMIHPEICRSCQLVAGMTLLKPGNLWNTMPAHTHDRRSEAYLYFDLPPDSRVVHLMGEPEETRHLVVSNEQAILSPGWSIHSGVGTTRYGFVWAMGGDNQDFTDMDMVPMESLR